MLKRERAGIIGLRMKPVEVAEHWGGRWMLSRWIAVIGLGQGGR